MATANYQSYRIGLWAEIQLLDKPWQIDVLSCQLSQQLDEIPGASADSCTVTIALGRNAATGVISDIHMLVDDLKILRPIKIYAFVIPNSNSLGDDLDDWPKKPFLLFDGYVYQTSWDTQFDDGNGSATCSLSCIHWLYDLASTSSITSSTHGISAEQLSMLSTMGGGAGASPSFISATNLIGLAQPVNITTDLWEKVYGEYLKRLCTRFPLQERAGGMKLERNTIGLSALDRIEPFNRIVDNTGIYTWGTALSLKAVDNTVSGIVAGAIAASLARNTMQGGGLASAAAQTLWDALLAFASTYGCRIVPLVNTALIVPFIPGYRNQWTKIHGQEYSRLALHDTGLRRPIRSVRLTRPFTSVAGLPGTNRGATTEIATFAGRYVNPDLKNGMILYGNAPHWLAHAALPSSYAAGAAVGVKGNAVDPGAGAAIDKPKPEQVAATLQDFWDNFARTMYVQEILKSRGGHLVGRLRFDIGPGSTIAIQVVPERFVAPQLTSDMQNRVLYAEVAAVQHAISSESPTARTSFRLINVRTAKENEADATSLPSHPYYTAQWRGCPSVDMEEFRSNFADRFFEVP